jgi:hypothetical protein
MGIDERLERIAQDVQFLLAVERSHDDQIARDAIGRLANIADAHQDRLDNHGQRLDDLERQA